MKGKIVNIIPWVLMLIGIVLLATFFNKDDGHVDYQEALKAKDDMIRALIIEREADRAMREAAILDLHKKDSLLQQNFKTTVIKYEKIPVLVGNLSDSALRSAIENYR